MAAKKLLLLLASLFALLLAGCSGEVETDDDGDANDGDADGGINGDADIDDGENNNEDDNDAPGAALGVMLVVLGLAAFIRRKA